MTTTNTKGQQPPYYIHHGIEQLVKAAGENSRDHGFHEDWPVFPGVTVTATGEPAERHAHLVPEFQRQLGLAITEKLALIHEEVSEALGEIRSGHAPEHVYYSNVVKLKPFMESLTTAEHRTWAEQDFEPLDDALPEEGSKPVLKPEGFGIELADAVIRIADLAYLTGIDLGALINEKMAYNATRERKHGRKF